MKGTQNRKQESFIVFCLFFCLAILITWPLVTHLTDTLYGELGDPLNTVLSLKWFKEAVFSNQGAVWTFPYAAYPHGVRTTFSLSYLPLIPLFAPPHGEAMLYNVIIIFFIALNGYVMYLLGRRLFGSSVVAIGMGLVYIFCPYAITRARYHLSLVPIFIFPLLLYALFNLRQDFTKANKVKLFFSFLLAFSMHPYYTVMALLMLIVLAALYFIRRLFRSAGSLFQEYPFIRICILLCALSLLITIPLTYIHVSLIMGKSATLTRQEGDLYTYAGNAWNYVIPSTRSLFFGDSVQQFVKNNVAATNIEEYVLFLGYTNIGLALIAVLIWLLRKHNRMANGLTQDLAKNAGWLVMTSSVSAAIFFTISLPPTIRIGGLSLYMPSWLFYKVIPSIRVYARFGVLVFFYVTLLNGVTLSLLVRALRGYGKSLRYIIPFVVILLLVSGFVESSRAPLQYIYEQDVIYAQVRDLGASTVIVEYPFVAYDESYNYLYEWNAIFHRKNMINGYGPGTEGESMRNCVLNLFDERTPGLLSFMGADYVVVHKDFFEEGSEYTYPPNRIDLENLPWGYEIVTEDEKSALLRIEAPRPDAVVVYDPRFSTARTQEFGDGWWLGEEQRWMVKIDALYDQVSDIRFEVFSVQGERTLQIDLGQGEIKQYRISEDCQEVLLQGIELQSGINRIYLRTDEDAVPYRDIFGGNDRKGICLAMSFWRIERE